MRRLGQIFNGFWRLPKKQRWFLGLSLAGSIAIQLLIPSNVILPRTYLDGKAVGLQDKTTFDQTLAEESQSLKMIIGDSIQEFQSDEVGLDLNVQETVEQLPTFSLKDRLIPLVSFINIVRGSQKTTVVTRNNQRIQQFAQELAKSQYKNPVDAKVEIKDGHLLLSEAQPGQRFHEETIEKALVEVQPFSGQPVEVEGEKLDANISKEDLRPLEGQFKRVTAQPLKVKYGDTIKEVEPKTISGWLTAVKQESDWRLTLNQSAFKDTVEGWAREYNLPSGTTQVNMLDDVEVARVSGAAGRALDQTAVSQQLDQWVQQPETEPIALTTVVVSPKVVVTRTYSRDSAALQAKLNAWIAAHPGRYQVAIRELGGRGREASYNVLERTVMASTYKTFLAFVAYRQAEAGALDLGAPLAIGKNIEQCIEYMIIVSDDTCSVALGRHIGWAKVDQSIAASGFQNVKLNNYDAVGNLNGDKLVNAREQATFLAQLSAGSLINGGNTGKLMGYMKRQVYRNGIPAGSRGAVVADKVGFLDNYIHDVGIVYGRKSTYAIVIMSEGSNWTNIRDLAQAVYDFMNE